MIEAGESACPPQSGIVGPEVSVIPAALAFPATSAAAAIVPTKAPSLIR